MFYNPFRVPESKVNRNYKIVVDTEDVVRRREAMSHGRVEMLLLCWFWGSSGWQGKREGGDVFIVVSGSNDPIGYASPHNAPSSGTEYYGSSRNDHLTMFMEDVSNHVWLIWPSGTRIGNENVENRNSTLNTAYITIWKK